METVSAPAIDYLSIMNNSHSRGRPGCLNCDAECYMKSGSVGMLVQYLFVAFPCQNLLVFVIVSAN